jgi:hypothetical protein
MTTGCAADRFECFECSEAVDAEAVAGSDLGCCCAVVIDAVFIDAVVIDEA